MQLQRQVAPPASLPTLRKPRRVGHPLHGTVSKRQNQNRKVEGWATRPIQFVTGAPYFYASNSPLNFVDPSGLAPGDWWDPRTPGNVWNQLNPFNPNGSLSNTATSVWDSLSGMATGNSAQAARPSAKGP